MNLSGFFLAAVFLPLLASADEALEHLKQGLPSPVAGFVDRAANCNHWAGEEPYDAERAAEINNALSELRCSSLDADEAQLLKRYKGNAAIERAIREGRQYSL